MIVWVSAWGREKIQILFNEGISKRRGKGNVPEMRNSPNMT